MCGTSGSVEYVSRHPQERACSAGHQSFCIVVHRQDRASTLQLGRAENVHGGWVEWLWVRSEGFGLSGVRVLCSGIRWSLVGWGRVRWAGMGCG